MCKDNKEKVCAYCGSNHRVGYCKEYGDYLCDKHIYQLRKRGYFYDIFTNKYRIINDDTAEMTVSYKGTEYSALLDLEDLDRVLKACKWCLNPAGYVYNGHNSIYLHRFILNCCDSNIYVDHINHNKLDNRKCNLRLATPQQNTWNSTSKNGTCSKFKGVRKTNNQRWVATGTKNQKTYVLGRYSTELEAAYAHNLWITKEYGEFANLNEFTEDEWLELQKLLPLQTTGEKAKLNKTSKYKYVDYSSSHKYWRYRRRINGKLYGKTGFKTEEEAYDAYIERMKEIGVEP